MRDTIPDFAALNRAVAKRKNSERMKKAWVTRRKPKLGRPLLYPDTTMLRLPKGSLRRINRALKPDESQSGFLRAAVEKALQVRGL